MGLFESGFKVGAVVMVGLGAAILAPAILPAVAVVGKPLAKKLLKSGLLMVQKGQELFTDTREDIEDLIAEVRSEVVDELKPPRPFASSKEGKVPNAP